VALNILLVLDHCDWMYCAVTYYNFKRFISVQSLSTFWIIHFCWFSSVQVARLESQVIRYKSASESAEKIEDELKVEKRKLQREVRVFTCIFRQCSFILSQHHSVFLTVD